MSEERKGLIALVVLAWVFATMGVFGRYLDFSFDIFEQTYLRIAVAFLLSCLFFYKKVDFSKYFGTSKKDIAILTLRAVSLYLAVVFITQGIILAKFANASLISTLPLMPIFGYIFLREKLNTQTIFWIIIGFIGSLVITFQSGLILGKGELYALISLVFFDLSYVLRKKHTNYLNNYETTTFMFGVGAVFLFITSVLLGESLLSTSNFTLMTITVIVIAGFFNVMNLFLTNYGFDKVKAGVAGNIITLEIVFALIYGLFLYKEIPVLREIIGGSIIAFSVYMVNKSENLI